MYIVPLCAPWVLVVDDLSSAGAADIGEAASKSRGKVDKVLIGIRLWAESDTPVGQFGILVDGPLNISHDGVI